MNIKKKIAGALLAVLSVTALTVPAFADDRYRNVDEVAGTEFVQFFAMEDFVQSCPSECPEDMEPEVYDYVKSAEGVYVPEGVTLPMSVEPEDVTSVLVTPTYCRTSFSDYELYYYYDTAAGRSRIESAEYFLENNQFAAIKETVNGNTVYRYVLSQWDERYVWKQDGKYFELSSQAETDDEKFYIETDDEKFYMCNAVLIPFEMNFNIQEIDGKLYCKNPDGTYATGWKTVDGNRYYFKKSGQAVTKNCTIGGVRYKFGSDGVCQGKYTGWTKSNGNRYYYKDGIKQTGWVKFAKGWRYFSADGVMAAGDVTLEDGQVYRFSNGGIWDGKVPDDALYTVYSKMEKSFSRDNYAGAYVDGNMLIVTAKDPAAIKGGVDKLRKTYAPIAVKQCKFSGAELEEVRSFLEEHMTEYGIVGVGTYVMDNRVGIDISADAPNAALRAYLDSLPDKDIVTVATGVHIVLDD